VLPADATDAAGLFLAADLALYNAKKQGKDRYVFYDQVAQEPEVLLGTE
jgi:GGDEF domain-containing protein